MSVSLIGVKQIANFGLRRKRDGDMKNKLKGVLLCSAIAVMVSCFALAGCSSNSSSNESSSSDSAVQLQIFAANSLEKALPEVQELYTKEHPNVTFADSQFKASGDLVSTLIGGGSADVLITASSSTMDDASNGKVIDDSTRMDMFTNDLVICTKEGSNLKIKSIKDLATNKNIKSIAIGDPATVPAGNYAFQALDSADLVKSSKTNDQGKPTDIVWAKSISDKMNAGADKVGTVASYVQSGQATVGFVYTSDIYRYDGIQVAYTTPASSHKTIMYPCAVCSGSSHAEEAADFLNFCATNAQAKKVFQKYGFELAD